MNRELGIRELGIKEFAPGSRGGDGLFRLAPSLAKHPGPKVTAHRVTRLPPPPLHARGEAQRCPPPPLAWRFLGCSCSVSTTLPLRPPPPQSRAPAVAGEPGARPLVHQEHHRCQVPSRGSPPPKNAAPQPPPSSPLCPGRVFPQQPPPAASVKHPPPPAVPPEPLQRAVQGPRVGTPPHPRAGQSPPVESPPPPGAAPGPPVTAETPPGAALGPLQGAVPLAKGALGHPFRALAPPAVAWGWRGRTPRTERPNLSRRCTLVAMKSVGGVRADGRPAQVCACVYVGQSTTPYP